MGALGSSLGELAEGACCMGVGSGWMNRCVCSRVCLPAVALLLAVVGSGRGGASA